MGYGNTSCRGCRNDICQEFSISPPFRVVYYCQQHQIFDFLDTIWTSYLITFGGGEVYLNPVL